MVDTVGSAVLADPIQTPYTASGQSKTGVDKTRRFFERAPVFLYMDDFARPHATAFPPTVSADFIATVTKALNGSAHGDVHKIARQLRSTKLGKKLTPATTQAIAEYVLQLAGLATDGKINPGEEKKIQRSIGHILDKVQSGGLLPTRNWQELGNLLYGLAGRVRGQTSGIKNSRIVHTSTTDAAKAWREKNDTAVHFKGVGEIRFSDIAFAVSVLINEIGDTYGETVAKKMLRNKALIERKTKELIEQIEKSKGMPPFLKWILAVLTIIVSVISVLVTGGALAVAIPAVIMSIMAVVEASGLTDDLLKVISKLLQAFGMNEKLADKFAFGIYIYVLVACAITSTVGAYKAGAGFELAAVLGYAGAATAHTAGKSAQIAQAASQSARAMSATARVAETTASLADATASLAAGVAELKGSIADSKTYLLKSSLLEAEMNVEESGNKIREIFSWFIPNMWKEVRKMVNNQLQTNAQIVKRF